MQLKPTDKISFSVGNDTITVASADWNTIIDTSSVPRNVTVTLDPDFNASPTTRNRFQYLADLIHEDSGGDFDMYSIASVPDGGDVITLAAYVNPGSSAVRLVHLDLSVTVGPPTTTETTGSFYASAGHSIVIGAKSIYFARLTSPLIKTVPHSKQTDTHFHYTTIPCKTVAC